MGIDGIGKPGPPVAPASSSATPAAADIERPSFADHAIETRATSSAEAPHGALEQLKAGAIDLDQYLDIKVHEATTALAPLPPAQVESIRSALRERLASDPTLVDLVRTAAGAIPSPRVEE
jgi:hypothetical protein